MPCHPRSVTRSLLSCLVPLFFLSSSAFAQNVQIGVPLSLNQSVAIQVHNDGWQAAKFTSYYDYAVRASGPGAGGLFEAVETVGVSPDDVSALEAKATCIATSTGVSPRTTQGYPCSAGRFLQSGSYGSGLTSEGTRIGVYGIASDAVATAAGVQGQTAYGYGVLGTSTHGTGVRASSSSGMGVSSYSSAGWAGYFDSPNAGSLYAWSGSIEALRAFGSGSSASAGSVGVVYAATLSGSNHSAVIGVANQGSSSGNGVVGVSNGTNSSGGYFENPNVSGGYGLAARGHGGYALHAQSNGSGWAGYFWGNVHVNGTLSKSAGSFSSTIRATPLTSTSFIRSSNRRT